ncbi:MAG: formate dehydrogenase accessory sulfurtransferase FdhD [Cyclobacteriaceae bacterium]|nr:formate dehydrogenase accessory sulfurtransferase FdhD [Cyclobacteriaceae bacterium]
MNKSVQQTKILRVNGTAEEEFDLLAVEEPMEIRLGHGPSGQRRQSTVSVTMRTSGHDFELALGFLYTEGIVRQHEEVERISYCQDQGKQHHNNVVRVELSAGVVVDTLRLKRNSYMNSGCGVCGKTSIDAIEAEGLQNITNGFEVEEESIHSAPGILTQAQLVFKYTGGLHAAGLFDRGGKLLLWREDVGRHNALDKVLGASLQQKIALKNTFLFLSGRIGFELVQKALVANIPVVAAVGAPSSLAVDLARRFDMTLLGFVREGGFNIYCGNQRVKLNTR